MKWGKSEFYCGASSRNTILLIEPLACCLARQLSLPPASAACLHLLTRRPRRSAPHFLQQAPRPLSYLVTPLPHPQPPQEPSVRQGFAPTVLAAFQQKECSGVGSVAELTSPSPGCGLRGQVGGVAPIPVGRGAHPQPGPGSRGEPIGRLQTRRPFRTDEDMCVGGGGASTADEITLVIITSTHPATGTPTSPEGAGHRGRGRAGWGGSGGDQGWHCPRTYCDREVTPAP